MFRLITPAQIELDRKNWMRILELADTVIKECRDCAAKSEISPNTRFFLLDLAAYLEKRKAKNSGSDNDLQIQNRSYFIKGIVDQLNNGNQPDLSEDKIKVFKGTFSHDFYDILKHYRDGRGKAIELVEIESSSVFNP